MKNSQKKLKSTPTSSAFKIGLSTLGVAGLASFGVFYDQIPFKEISVASSSLFEEVEAKIHHEFEASHLLVQTEPLSLTSSELSTEKNYAPSPSMNDVLLVDTYTPTEETAPAPKGYQRPDFTYYFDIGGNYTHVDFEPHGNPSFHGNLGGAQGGFEFKPLNNFYEGLLVSWKQGHMNGSSGKRSLLYIDIQERLGYTAACHRFACTLFTGLGYRHLGQKYQPNVGGDLKFRLNTFYIPVGAATEYAFTSWFSMGLNATWMPQVYPTISISPLKGARWMLTKKLSSFSVQLPINFTVTQDKKFHIIFNPFYERWVDGHSTAKTSSGVSLGLPGNTYKFWGGELNFLYSF
jgi:hypothetical protein